MAEIKETFSGEPETVVMAVDFQEIATGTAYITYYLQDLVEGTASAVKMLGENIVYSKTGYTTAAALDVDFDLNFDVPFSIEGDATMNIWFSSASTFSTNVFINFKHVDSLGAETQIGTQVQTSINVANNSDDIGVKYNIPLTTFKDGETLRLIVTNTDPGSGKLATVLHDPKDRTALGQPGVITHSQSIINLPVRI